MLAYYSEYSFKERDEWERIANGEAALQALMAACYLGMMGFAAKAVHVWRKNGKRPPKTAAQRVDELLMESREEGEWKGGSAV